MSTTARLGEKLTGHLSRDFVEWFQWIIRRDGDVYIWVVFWL